MYKILKTMSLMLYLSGVAFNHLAAMEDYDETDEKIEKLFKNWKEPVTIDNILGLLQSNNREDAIKAAFAYNALHEQSTVSNREEIYKQAISLTESEDPYLQASGCFIILCSGKQDTQKALEKLQNSPSEMVRFIYSSKMSEYIKEDQEKYWEEIRHNFSNKYQFEIDLILVDLKKNNPEKIQWLNKLIESETTIEKKNKLMLRLGNIFNGNPNDEIYDCKKAAYIYQVLLKQELQDKLKFKVLERLACVYSNGDESIKDLSEAQNIYEKILANKDKAPSWVYQNALNGIININANSDDPEKKIKAYELAMEIWDNQSLGEPRYHVMSYLLQLLQYGPEKIKNPQKAYELAEQVYKDESTPQWCRSNALGDFISINANSDDPEKKIKAYELAEKVWKDQFLGERRYNVISNLLYLLQYGPEEIKNPQKAYELAEQVYQDESTPEWCRPNAIYQLSQLLQYGPEDVKNISRAIEILENWFKNTKFKQNDAYLLAQLAHLYHRSEHSNPKKAIELYNTLAECKGYEISSLKYLIEIYSSSNEYIMAQKLHYRLIDFCSNKPEQEIEALKNLLEFYNVHAANKEIFNLEEVKQIAARLNEHPNTTEEIKLYRLIRLSAIYDKHRDKGSQEERAQVNLALAHHPMVNSLDRRDAFERLRAVYIEQNRLEDVVNVYNEDLAGTAGWNRTLILNQFIFFLEANPDLDAVRLLELINERDHGNAEVQLEGLAPGFGGQNPVDPYFNPTIIENRKRSIEALSKHPLDPLAYEKNISEVIKEITEVIEQYGKQDEDCEKTATHAMEVFVKGNNKPNSFQPVVKDLDYTFSYGDGSQTMKFGELLLPIWSYVKEMKEPEMFVVQLAAAIDPDGHIVCPIGKLTRMLQLLEGKIPGINVVTLVSLADITSGFFKKQASVPLSEPLEQLSDKLSKMFKNKYVEDGPRHDWIEKQHQNNLFNALEKEDQDLLNNYRKKLISELSLEAIKARGNLSEEDKKSIAKQVNDSIGYDWL